MSPLLLRRPSASLTGSASLVTADPARSSSPTKRRSEASWQTRAWEYFDALGEIKYPSRFYSRSLAKLILKVEQQDGKGGWEDTADPKANGALERITSGNVPRMLGTYGQLTFLVGECYLVCFFKELGEEEWDVLSTSEFVFTDGVYKRTASTTGTATEYKEADPLAPQPGEAIAFRMWREHPRYSDEADSSVRGVLDICEELLLLQQAIRATAKSRSAGNGVLFMPEEMDPPPIDALAPPEDPREQPFTERLTAHIIAPIGDEGSAAAVAPLVVTGPAEYLSAPRFMTFGASELYKEVGLRQEAIQRIAIGLDLPPEILTGVAGANHWSAWAIDEDSFKNHIAPVADEMAADLTDSFFRPTLAREGVADPSSFRIHYDSSQLVVHPNRGQDAKDTHDRLVISDKALRAATGFNDGDAPSQLELEQRVERLRPKVNGGPGVVQAHPAGTVAPDPGAPVIGPETGVQPGPPQQTAAVARLYAAAELCVWRARELAGSRVRSTTKEPASAAKIKGVPNRAVCATLGSARVAAEPDALVAGGGDTFAERLCAWGYEPTVAAALVRECEEHAAVTLFERDPTLNDTIVGLCHLAALRAVTA